MSNNSWMDAKIGDVLDLGMTNFGTERLRLPVVRITKTTIVCSDGIRTESVMKTTGRRRGLPVSHAARIVEKAK